MSRDTIERIAEAAFLVFVFTLLPTIVLSL